MKTIWEGEIFGWRRGWSR